ncbi:MAG: hypothetical protein MJ162_03535 [Treponema sp.]|nr:hypothetical protein [Treponema sp.]
MKIINCLKKEGQPRVSSTDGGFHDVLGPGRFLLMLDEDNKTEITVNNKQEVCPRLAAFVGKIDFDCRSRYGFERTDKSFTEVT